MTATATAAVPVNDLKLQIRRTYNTDPVTLFNAWTDAEVISQWFGPPNRAIKSVTSDQRAGGAYRIEMGGTPAEPESVVLVHGTYTVFEPGKLLVFTWQADWAPGEKSQVTVALTPSGAGTELLLTHARFDTEMSRDGHRSGWEYALGSIAKLFPAA
jgi:uncharacterized protein YndB with AHSA1/START domain